MSILFGQILIASEISTTSQTFVDKFCQAFQTENLTGKFCMSDEIIYPLVTSEDKTLETNINKAIKEHIGSLQKGKSKEYVLNTIKEGLHSTMGHDSQLTVNILSITPKTFSLEITSSAYLGGAHGSYNTSFANYDRVTGKVLKLDDLFISNYKNKLKSIAEKEYRIQTHIKPTDSLSDKLFWFDNKFILAENIGIEKGGLHLEYNPYEIKPYSEATTTLILRYELLKSLIKPHSYLDPLIKQSDTYRFYDSFLDLTLQIKKLTKDTIELNLEVQNSNYNISKGGVSLSFIQLKNKSSIINKESQNFSKILVYPKRSAIYHFKKKKNIKSDYLLVEAESDSWKYNKSKNLKLILKIPKKAKYFDINIRTTIIKDKKILNIPYRGKIGQQGVGNYSVRVER